MTVIYSPSAENDINGIFEYLADTLGVPETAVKIVKKLYDSADSLESMPQRHGVIDREPFKRLGLRILPVDNYVILYSVDENGGLVLISRIIYSRRNLDTQLSDSDTY